MDINNNIPSPPPFPIYLNEPKDCGICLEPLSRQLAIHEMADGINVKEFVLINKDDKTPLHTECDHLFHLRCLKTWVELKKNQISNCPTCRHDFKFIGDAPVPRVVSHQEAFRHIAETYGNENEQPNDNEHREPILFFPQQRTLGTDLPNRMTAVSSLAALQVSSLVVEHLMNAIRSQDNQPEPIDEIQTIPDNWGMPEFRLRGNHNVPPQTIQQETLEEMDRVLERFRNEFNLPKEFLGDKSNENNENK